jgi:hypothetical protein
MKIISAIALFIALNACEGRNLAPGKAIVGRWEWVKSVGGIAGMTYKASENDHRQMVFTNKGDFEFLINGQSVSKRKYEVKKGRSISSTEPVTMIFFVPDSTASPLSFHVESDTLYLSDEFNDGFQSSYVRIK